MHRATCEGCGKVYRVSDPDRVHRCKACGGAVRAAGAAVVTATESSVDCASCGAPNDPEAKFCKHCGAATRTDEAGARTPKDEVERQLARRELTATFGILRTLRFLYAIFAVF